MPYHRPIHAYSRRATSLTSLVCLLHCNHLMSSSSPQYPQHLLCSVHRAGACQMLGSSILYWLSSSPRRWYWMSFLALFFHLDLGRLPNLPEWLIQIRWLPCVSLTYRKVLNVFNQSEDQWGNSRSGSTSTNFVCVLRRDVCVYFQLNCSIFQRYILIFWSVLHCECW